MIRVRTTRCSARAAFAARASLGALAALQLSAPAAATTFTANPSNYLNVLSQLQPGDRMELASGTYSNGFTLTGVSGTAAAPIVITGPADSSARFTARNCCNTVQLDGNSYLEIRNLTVDGAGGSGVDAVNSRGITHHISIIGLSIVNHDDDQGTVGISTKGPAWNWVIRGNTINTAGTGMYLGNSDATMPFVAGLIEHNVFIDTIGYNTEIKHQGSRTGIAGMPTGDQKTIIRHNVFSKANNASGGADARPNLLIGHFPLSGLGSNDLYEIYGNFFYQNPSEALFQGEGNIALYDNVFINNSGSAINIQPHNDRPRNITVFHNTVVASDTGISVSGGASGFTQRSIGNLVFASSPVSSPNASSNITGTFAAAATFLVAPMAPLGTLDLTPLAGQATGAAIDLTQFASFTDSNRDFNGVARVATYRGAYTADGPNSGWRLAVAIKPPTGSVSNPVITFSANPNPVTSGTSTTLTWSTTNADGCTAAGAWNGTKATSGSQMVGPLTAAQTYTLNCTNTGGGSASSSVTVDVAGTTPAPTVNFSASPNPIAAGSSTTLTWSSTDATSCTGSGGLAGWAGAKALQGSQSVGPLSAATSYTLACSGGGGTTQRNVTVNLLPAPTVTLSASPTSVTTGSPTTLTWSSQNATVCNASGAWAGQKATAGSEQSASLNATSTFTLACDGPGGSASRGVTVTVSASPPAPTVSLSASPTSVAPGSTTTLTWSSTNATGCTASGGWSGARGTSGSETSGALSNTATFTLGCAGAGGSTSQSVTVTVTAGGGGGSGGGNSGGGAIEWWLLAVTGLALIRRQRQALAISVA